MSTIVHFDLPSDDLERSKNFYEKLFNWKFQKLPPMDYYFIETLDDQGNKGVPGGMGKRGAPGQAIVNYMGVNSVEEYMVKVKDLGGKIIMGKTSVPGWGYLAVCQDTENNTFGLWQEDKTAT